MRSGVIIDWPKEGKPPVAKYFERYQDARDESAKLREDSIRHELWSKHSGLERRVHGGKSCVNFDAAKHIPSDREKRDWAKKAMQVDAAEEQAKIARSLQLKEPPTPKTDTDAAKDLDLEENE